MPGPRRREEGTLPSSPAGCQRGWLNLDEPVIALTCARSGSTLLRLLLDAHPDLACPPETTIVQLCAQLTAACQLLEGPDAEPAAGAAACASVRAMMDAIFADFLRRQGKTRWCEKSLGTAEAAEPFLRLYPQAKFICLYRHCMDVIDSALEATPWGLNGYGFDRFAARSPGNDIAALAAYWCETTSRTAAFEEAHPDRCLRVYYEELAADPERTMKRIFSFIGVAGVPGTPGRYLTGDSHMTGPGDHKVGATTAISADSVGRGIRVPVDLIHPAQLQGVNDILARLGYTQIDSIWRKAVQPPYLLPARPSAAAVQACADAGPAEPPYQERLLDEMGKIVRARIDPRVGTGAAASLSAAGVLGPLRAFGIAAYGEDTVRCWRIDIDRALLTERTQNDVTAMDWLLTGDIGTWSAVLCGYENFSTSIRSRAIRYIDLSDEEPEIQSRNSRDHARVSVIQQLLAPPVDATTELPGTATPAGSASYAQ